MYPPHFPPAPPPTPPHPTPGASLVNPFPRRTTYSSVALRSTPDIQSTAVFRTPHAAVCKAGPSTPDRIHRCIGHPYALAPVTNRQAANKAYDNHNLLIMLLKLSSSPTTKQPCSEDDVLAGEGGEGRRAACYKPRLACSIRYQGT